QNVIRSTIEDTTNGPDSRSCHSFANSTENWRPCHHSGFHTQLYSVLVGQGKEFICCQCSRAFIGSNDMHSLRQSGTDMADAGLCVTQVGTSYLCQDISTSSLQSF